MELAGPNLPSLMLTGLPSLKKVVGLLCTFGSGMLQGGAGGGAGAGRGGAGAGRGGAGVGQGRETFTFLVAKRVHIIGVPCRYIVLQHQWAGTCKHSLLLYVLSYTCTYVHTYTHTIISGPHT